MKKEQVLARMKEDCLVAVVRAKNLEQGEKVVDAIIAGGINFIEITMTMDEGNPVEFIAAMAKKYKDDDKIVIGAGTVLDPETARQVILAGANYVVSPGLNVDTIKLCNRYRVPMLPGVMTPTEAITALEAGCDVIKVFPGNIVGPAAISSFKGPLPQGEFMPSGGVDVDNVDKWLKAGSSTADEAERIEIYSEMYNAYYDTHTLVPLVVIPSCVAYSKDLNAVAVPTDYRVYEWSWNS